jgi:hypothetical protein
MEDGMSELFKTTNDFNAVMVGDDAYVAVPDQKGGDFHVFTGRGRTFNDRFWNTGKRVASIESFVAYVEDIQIHEDHLQRLGRIRKPAGAKTPWGAADGVTVYDPGVMFYSTPGHAGFKVYKKLNQLIPEHYRNENGWYEHHCEWAKVAVTFPHLFTDLERRPAEKTLKNYFPEAYEAVNGVVLSEAESFKKAEAMFALRNADNYVVISASQKDEHPGMAVCTATLGGVRGGYRDGVEIPSPEHRTFLVPLDEYRTRSSHGFVIDLEKHLELVPEDAPSLAM